MPADDREPTRGLAALGGLGFSMAALVIGGALLGYYLDGRWGTSPWLTIAGLFLGLGAGFFEVITMAKKAEQAESDEEK